MVVSSLNARLEKPAGARDRIVTHLIKHKSTIESLATRLGVTKNAVRAQIALLQREGIVEDLTGHPILNLTENYFIFIPRKPRCIKMKSGDRKQLRTKQ